MEKVNRTLPCGEEVAGPCGRTLRENLAGEPRSLRAKGPTCAPQRQRRPSQEANSKNFGVQISARRFLLFEQQRALCCSNNRELSAVRTTESSLLLEQQKPPGRNLHTEIS